MLRFTYITGTDMKVTKSKKKKEPAPIYGVSLQVEAAMMEIVAYLKKNKKYEKVDEAAMHILATQLDVFHRLAKEVKAEGPMVWNKNETKLITNPKLFPMNQAETYALKIMKEYGLTALARKNLGKMDAAAEESPLEKFISGAK
jgi:P27 family predicted phage terminase small subunit